MSDKDSILEVYRIIRCHPPEYLQLSRRVCYFPYIVKNSCPWVYLLRVRQHLIDRIKHVVIVERNSPDDVDYLEWGCIVELYAFRIARCRVSCSTPDADALTHQRAV